MHSNTPDSPVRTFRVLRLIPSFTNSSIRKSIRDLRILGIV